MLTAVQLPEVDELADLLVAELNALSMALILVLDDYHRIRSRDVHAIMRHLLRYLPAGLHLVILTRSDPPLHLQRLRLGQQLTEIHATDLCFTLTETRHFLRAQTGQPLPNKPYSDAHPVSCLTPGIGVRHDQEGWFIDQTILDQCWTFEAISANSNAVGAVAGQVICMTSSGMKVLSRRVVVSGTLAGVYRHQRMV